MGITWQPARLLFALIVAGFALTSTPCWPQHGPGSLQVTAPTPAMRVGVDPPQALVAKRTFFRANGRAVAVAARWSSSNTAVATVDPRTGVVTSVTTGTATITAIGGPFGVGSAAVEVVPSSPLTSITISAPGNSIPKGLTEQYTAIANFSGTMQDVTAVASWNSADVSGTSVAVFNSAGVAKGNAVGSANITASLKIAGVTTTSNTLALSVTPAVLESLMISPAPIFMAAPTPQQPSTLQLRATGIWTDGHKDNTNDASWSCDNPTVVASVGNIAGSNKGLVTAIGSGGSHAANIANVTATLSDTVGNTRTMTTPISLMTYNEAGRFLEQASFGPSPASVAHLQSIGFNGYLAEQFAMPQAYSLYSAAPDIPTVQNQFYNNALTAPDQLRQRVAFALEQIWVISSNKVGDPNGFVPWQNMMEQDAFGNYRQLMNDVTLNPAMGVYLDMVNNDAPVNGINANPNENYARELLQLFTVGVNLLNPDGTLQLDASHNPIPTYDESVVQGFAHVFTGWTFPTRPSATPHRHNPVYYGLAPFGSPMVVVDETDHDSTNTKKLLGTTVLPAGQSSSKDLSDAMDNIFQHANVGPFVCQQLIEHLVKSNPSPAYVGRVAAVFADDGTGTRGNLQAVVKAILMDPEARAEDFSALPNLVDANEGHLREPALFMVSVLRALSSSDGGSSLANRGAGMGESILTPGSVFNFFPPDYVIPMNYFPITPPAQAPFGPEFAIETPLTATQRVNFVNTVVYGSLQSSVNATLQGYVPLASTPAALVDTLNIQLMHGQMSQAMHDRIVTAVTAYSASSPLQRVQAAVYLTLSSSQWQVMHRGLETGQTESMDQENRGAKHVAFVTFEERFHTVELLFCHRRRHGSRHGAFWSGECLRPRLRTLQGAGMHLPVWRQ